MKYTTQDVEKYVSPKRNYVGKKVVDVKIRYLALLKKVNRGAESIKEVDEFLTIEAVLVANGEREWLQRVKN